MIDKNIVLSQILKQCAEVGTNSIGRTKLVKLVYLTEYEYYKQTRKRLTTLNWIFHKYGPYAFELSTDKIDFIETEHKELDAIRTAKLLSISKENNTAGQNDPIDIRVESIIKDEVKKWHDSDLKELLNFVYHHTEPMQDVHRGDILDFSSISEPYTRKTNPLSKKKLEEIKTKLRKTSKKEPSKAKPLYPLPRLTQEWQMKIQKALESEFEDEQEFKLKDAKLNIPIGKLKNAFEEE